jgi:hypothetical protein
LKQWVEIVTTIALFESSSDIALAGNAIGYLRTQVVMLELPQEE